MEIFEELVFQRNLILSYISTLITLKNEETFEQAYKIFKSRIHYEKLDVEIFEVAYKFNKMEKNELEKQLDKFITNKTNGSILCENVIILVQVLTKTAQGKKKN